MIWIYLIVLALTPALAKRSAEKMSDRKEEATRRRDFRQAKDRPEVGRLASPKPKRRKPWTLTYDPSPPSRLLTPSERRLIWGRYATRQQAEQALRVVPTKWEWYGINWRVEGPK